MVPPPLRPHPARPRLAQPRGARRCSRTCSASGWTAASTASASTWRTGWPRPTDLPDQVVQPGEPAQSLRGHRGHACSSRIRATSRCGTSRRCTRSTARWRQVLDEYDGDRMAVAEAWTAHARGDGRATCGPTSCTRRSTSPGCWPPWSATAFADVVTDTLAAVEPVGASPTWVLSNHDVIRHPTRYGGGETGLARARAAILTMLALPGSAYLYQGEELGLEQVEVAPAFRQDPAWFRTGDAGPRRVPGADPVGRRRRRRSASGRARASRGSRSPRTGTTLTVEAQRDDPESMLSFYRAALTHRRTFATTAGDAVTMLDLGADVLAFRRGSLTVVLNCGSGPVPLPEGTVLFASGPVPGGVLPRGHGGLADLRLGQASTRATRCSGRARPRSRRGRRRSSRRAARRGACAGPGSRPQPEIASRTRRQQRGADRPRGRGRVRSGPRSTRCCTCLLIAPLSIAKVSTSAEERIGPVSPGAAASGTTRAAGPGARPGPASPITRRTRRMKTPTSCSSWRTVSSRDIVVTSPAGRRWPPGPSSSSRNTVVRSGTSLMNSTQTRASAANGTATRKMWPVACRRRARRSSGTARRGSARRGCCRLSCGSAGMPSTRSAASTLAVTWWAQHRTQRRDADRAAHRPEEGDDRAGRAQVGHGHVVLHRQHEVLHRRTEAEAQDRHEGADQRPGWSVSSIVREQGQPDDHQDHAADQVPLPAPGGGDDPAR